MNTILSISSPNATFIADSEHNARKCNVEYYSSQVAEYPNTLFAYNDHLHTLFKGHWQNATKMYANKGVFELSNFQTQVIGSATCTDFEKWIAESKELPHNVVEWDTGINGMHHFDRKLDPQIIRFRAEFSTFMKLSLVWRFLYNYRHYTYILDDTNTSSMYDILYKYAYLNNIHFTFRNIIDHEKK